MGGSSVYRDYIREQVAREDHRKESLERRGLAVITSAGAFATVLFALASLTIDENTLDLSNPARVGVSIALVCFLASAVLAIAINWPWKQREVAAGELRAELTSRWLDAQSEAEKMVGETDLKVFQSARSANNTRARLLLWAVLAQGVAVTSVAVTVFIIILFE